MLNHKKALLIIDMQKGSFTPQTPRYNTPVIIENINKIAHTMRLMSNTVIYIQHDGTGSGQFEKGNTDWELLDELETRSSDIFIDKYANDVFYRSDLQSVLEKGQVKELIITGCATDFCVESTVQSALTKDYKITVLKDGHTTGDRPHLSAKQVIDHYNWVWENMLPTQGSISLIETQDLVK